MHNSIFTWLGFFAMQWLQSSRCINIAALHQYMVFVIINVDLLL